MSEDQQLVLVETSEQNVVLTHEDWYVVTVGEQGPEGAPGLPGPAGGAAVQSQAGLTTSALRVVYELNGQVFYLDYRDAAHIGLLLGLTLTGAQAGGYINVQRAGLVEDQGWNWAPGRVWLGVDGALTQTPPSDGFDVLMGTALSATRLSLNPQDPIFLE